jgi:hypothetical protein
MALLIMISFLFIAGRSSGRLLMKNNLFIAPNNQLDFDPNLKALVDNSSRLHTANGHVEKDAVQCDEEKSPSSVKSAAKENTLSFRLSPSVPKIKKPQLPTDSADKAEGDFNLLPKGAVTPSEPSPAVNSLVAEQRLSTSSNSPEVAHMQMIRPKSQTINFHILKSYHSHGDDQVQRKKSNKRKLDSIPSPGAGH